MLALIALAAASATVPDGQALYEAIAKRDAEFFEVFFVGCDPARLAAMLTSDFEMYHDKEGLVANAADGFVAHYAKTCEARRAPNAWRSRRELVPCTMTVHRLNNYGAIEQGDHIFYERRGNGPEKKVGKARFTQVWKLEGGRWRLARVLSYDHAPVKPGG
jgi:hypothetical protein